MVTNALRSLWAEPRPPHPPRRVWRDGALVAVLLAWSLVEAVLREDLTSRPLVLAAVFVVLAPLWWRRTHPLGAVAISFGTLTAVDVVNGPGVSGDCGVSRGRFTPSSGQGAARSFGGYAEVVRSLGWSRGHCPAFHLARAATC
jgi:hypothetical protein